MGSGNKGIWTGSHLRSSANPRTVFPETLVDIGGELHYTVFCISRSFVPYVNHFGLKTMLIYTGGHCQEKRFGDTLIPIRGGCAFIYNNTPSGTVLMGLERYRQDGRPATPTKERVALRAAIAALNERLWWAEGFENVVIATSSGSLVQAATRLIRNWTTHDGHPWQENRDLWKALWSCLSRFAAAGCGVVFWRINEQQNARALQAAEFAAVEDFPTRDFDPFRVMQVNSM
ncbi:hypothetical protein F4778DRAFT_700234 [Xylariomycetidae sp. FL2044]|nr:hypothetical protein F4778DRAFT_700234 [Xylariomycetidae sp. FL2044]